jgi:trigger factor
LLRKKTQNKEAIAGADASGYDLIIGSKSFIPGFEDKLIGLKAKETTDFNLTFPKDYGVDSLKSKKVSFTVTINAIKELQMPKLDDKLVATFGPFKTVADFKKSIKEQLKNEKSKEALSKLDNELLGKITETSQVDIPDLLVEEEINRIEEEEKRNLVYRGQTWQEHLSSEGVTQEEHRERQRTPALTRVKSGLILGAIADTENISVSQNELDARLDLLKKTYQDEAMQAELAKPENIRDIRSRMMVEKTLEKIRALN